MKKKLLPIEINQPIRAYPNHLFINTVVNNSTTTGNTLADLTLSKANEKKWDVINEKSVVEFCDNKVTVSAEPYEMDTHSVIYRECDLIDEIICEVNYRQFTNPWDSIVLFMYNGEYDRVTMTKYEMYSYTFGKYNHEQYGVFSIHNKQTKGFSNDFLYPYKMKLSYNNGKIISYISRNEDVWTEIEQVSIDISHEKTYIGIGVFLSNNQYYNWLYMNYIQLKYDEVLTIFDYYSYPYKFYQRFSFHPFIAFFTEKRSVLKKYGWSEWDIITNAIDNNRYITVHLDEFYVPDREAYQKRKYIHENLVYGYCENENLVYIVGIFDGKPKLSVIHIDLFSKAYNFHENHWFDINNLSDNVVMMEHRSNEVLNIDVKQIIYFLNEYLNGINSGERIGWLAQPDAAIFGINVYEKVINTYNGRIPVISDLRVSYILYEHKKCMYERLKFLYIRKIINNGQYEKLKPIFEELVDISKNCMNRIIKNTMKPRKDIIELTGADLKRMKNLEQKYYALFKTFLEKFVGII